VNSIAPLASNDCWLAAAAVLSLPVDSTVVVPVLPHAAIIMAIAIYNNVIFMSSVKKDAVCLHPLWCGYDIPHPHEKVGFKMR
jgi:hypothetical protein